MIKIFLFLMALGLSQGAQIRKTKPKALTEPHPDCPATGHRLLPHEYDCTKFYYCEEGEKHVYPTDCTDNTEFSVALQVCVHPSIAGCTLPGSPTAAPSESASNNPATSTEVPNDPSDPLTVAYTETTEAPLEGTTEESCEDFFENGCPIDFDLHYLLPHETSCRKFYYCVHGEKVLSKCGSGSVFDAEKMMCVHSGSIDRSCEEEESTEEEDVTKEASEEQSSEEIERLPNGCPVNSYIPTYLPHDTYCNMYYQCNFGELVERPCAPGTQWNPAVKVCDYPYNVNCTLPGGDWVGEETEAPPADASTVEPPSDLLENGCPVDGSITWLVPHEDDCTQFYYCVWGDLVVMDCPAGLHFSLALQRCENPAIAGCICSKPGGSCDNNDNDSGCTGDNCDSNDDTECTGNDCDIDDVSGCTGNDCNNDDTSGCTGNNCDNDNVSGCTGNDCNNDDSSGCNGNNCDNDDDNNNNDDVSGCTGNDCDNNDVSGCTGNDCDNNDVSGCTGNDCDNDDVSSCTGNDCDNDTSVCTGSGCDNDVSGCTGEDCDNETNEDPDYNASSEHYCPEESNEDPNDKKCEEECNILPWAHEDCDKFWTCDGQKAVLVVCGEGLHFNPSTHTCDFACNAGCIRNNIQTTAGQEGLKVFIPWNKVDKQTRSLLKLISH